MAERFWEATGGRTFVGRLEMGDDLVESIERFCVEREIRAAWVSAIGAVQHASFAYYEQDELRYLELESDQHHEIIGFIGNISIRDEKPFLHAHATQRIDRRRAPAARLPGLRGRSHDPRDDRRRACSAPRRGERARTLVARIQRRTNR